MNSNHDREVLPQSRTSGVSPFRRQVTTGLAIVFTWVVFMLDMCSCQDAPWIINFVPVSNSTDSSSATYVNDYPQGSSRQGVYCPNLPKFKEKEAFVLTSYMSNDVKPNIRLYNRNGTVLLSYQTGFRGHQHSFVKNNDPYYSIISSIWWSSTNEILYLVQSLQFSAAGDVSAAGNAFVSNSDRVVMVVDLPGTRYFVGLGISYVFKFDAISINMEAFRSLPGSNNYPSFLGPFNNGQNVLVVYAPMRWAVFSTTDLASLYSNTISMTFGALTVDNLNQNIAFSVVQNPLVLNKRSLTNSAFNVLASVNLPMTGLSFVLNLGTFDLIFMLPSVAERTPSSHQNTLLFYSKSSLTSYTFKTVNTVLDPIPATLMGLSNPTDLDSGMRYYFAFVRNSFYTYQSYYFLFDKCMSLDGNTLTCTTCPDGYWRAGASFAAPRRCLPSGSFPAGTGMNNITMTYEPCSLGVSCAKCLTDYQRCEICNFAGGYYSNNVTGTCLLKSEFPSKTGINPWTKQIASCRDTACLDCKDNIYECRVCDVANQFYLNETSKICQTPPTFAKGYGVVKTNDTIGACLDPNCGNCMSDVSLCQRCNVETSWYLNTTSGTCQLPSSFAPGSGVNAVSNTIEVCTDPNCLDCQLNFQACMVCDTSKGHYLNTSSFKCLLPALFSDGFGASTSNHTIEPCVDPHCIDCRNNFQDCVKCDVLSDWYLNSTSRSCQQPASFVPGFGVNTTSRTIEVCSDPNCLNCTWNVRICYNCNTTNQHFWEPASWRCLNQDSFPLKFGLDTTYSIISRCVDPNCLECPNDTSNCTKCDTDNGWYLDQPAAKCITVSQVAASFGIDVLTGKVVACVHPKCLDCKQDHKKCAQCDVVSEYYLNQTSADCQTPSQFDPGYGLKVATLEIAKCDDPNCLICQTNTQLCNICNVASGWYLNTTSAKCQNPTEFAEGYGLNLRNRASPTIRPCKHPYCLECSFQIENCTRCDWANNHYLNTTTKDCQVPQSFSSGFGVNKFSQTIDICRDSHCLDCHTDIQICTECNPTGGWYLNTGNGACQRPEQFPSGFGVNHERQTMDPCTDAFCVDCRMNNAICLKCDTDKNYFLNETSQKCQAPESFSSGWGVNLTSRKIVGCQDPRCTNCSYNYELCLGCDTAEQYFLHTDKTCIKVTSSLPLMRVGANLLSGRIEPCTDPSCDSCVLDVNQCNGCDFLNGFKMQGQVCVQSTSERPKLKTTESRFRDRTVSFQFYEEIQVANLTEFFTSFKVIVTDRVEGVGYTCSSKTEDLSRKLIKCTVHFLPRAVEITVISKLDMIAATMVIEDPNKIGSVPNGTIFGLRSSKLFTEYPMSAANFVTKNVEQELGLANIVKGIYNFRMVTFVIAYFVSPALSVIVDRTLSDLSHLSFMEGTVATYPDALFDGNMFSSRILGDLDLVPASWKSVDDISRCQTSPTLWRMSIQCSIIPNLNSELVVIPSFVMVCFMMQLLWNKVQNMKLNQQYGKVAPGGWNQRAHNSPNDVNLLISERAEANPSIDGTPKNQEASRKFGMQELNFGISPQEPACSPINGAVKDDFEDLPMPGESLEKERIPVPPKILMIPSIDQGNRQVRSENTPMEFVDSENIPRDIQSAVLKGPRQTKQCRELKFGSSEDIGSPTLQQSVESMRDLPEAKVEHVPSLANLEQQNNLQTHKIEKKELVTIEKKEELIQRSNKFHSGGTLISSPEPQRLADKEDNRWVDKLRLLGMQFVFCKFEATQLDYVFLSTVNVYYYSSSYLELLGFVLAILVLILYVWQGKQFYDLSKQLQKQSETSAFPSTSVTNIMSKTSPSSLTLQPGLQQKAGFFQTCFRQAAEKQYPGTVRLLQLVKAFVLARLLVTMFESPVLQVSFILLMEICSTVYIWRQGQSLTKSQVWFSNSLNVLRVLYITLKLLIELKATSEATNQLILGYCMMWLVLGSVFLTILYPFCIVCLCLVRTCSKSSKPLLNTKLTASQTLVENLSARPEDGMAMGNSKPMATIVSQDNNSPRREPQQMPTKDVNSVPRRILSGQRKKPSDSEYAKFMPNQVAPSRDNDFDRLPTLKKKPDGKAVTVEAQLAINIMVKAPPNKLSAQPDNIGL